MARYCQNHHWSSGDYNSLQVKKVIFTLIISSGALKIGSCNLGCSTQMKTSVCHLRNFLLRTLAIEHYNGFVFERRVIFFKEGERNAGFHNGC